MEPGMRYRDSIFGQLLKPLSRRSIGLIARAHGAEAYEKKFHTWDHLLALTYAQLSDATSLRALEANWNANSHHHYHLGTGKLARATLADANKRRSSEVFADVFTKLSAEADRAFRKEGAEMVRLIDSSPIPLGETIACRTWNGRIKGGKLHMVYEPGTDRPCEIEVTPANVNDIEIGKAANIVPGMTYVFDKGYCSYSWWMELHENGAFFVTRMKENARFERIARRALNAAEKSGDGYTVIDDTEIELIYSRNPKLDLPVRRIRIKRANGQRLTLITNDMTRTAAEIAGLYKMRWQIELLFRWIKQNLNLKTFLGRSENAIKLQIYAAMIAYLLLRLAARASNFRKAPIRFAELAGAALFVRKPLTRIDKPPEVNPSTPKPQPHNNQFELCYI
jgi:IS4 transposase